MNSKTLKEIIRIYKIDGMSVAEIAAALDISKRTVYKYLAIIRKEPKVLFKNLKIDFSDIINVIDEIVEKQKESKIMSPKNKDWNMFCKILNVTLKYYPCDTMTLKQSRSTLKEFFPEIDIEKTTDYFRSCGGFCDCEVLINVEDSSDNVKKEEE